MKKHLLFCALFSIIFSSVTQAQKISFTGNVYGFLGEKMLLVRKASKNVSFEGPISGAKIFIKGENGTITVFSDITGSYSFAIPDKGKYTVEILKEGYSTVNYNLIYDDAGSKSNYIVTSFILKKEDNSVNTIGDLKITTNGKLEFIANTTTQKKSSVDVLQSNKLLIEKAMTINNSSPKNIITKQTSPEKIIKPVKKEDNREIVILQQKIKDDSLAKTWSTELLNMSNTLMIDPNASIEDVKIQIEQSKKLLAQLNPDSENYKLLLAQISNAERQLQTKEALIESQKNEISNGHKATVFLSVATVVSLIFILLLSLFLKQKKKHNEELNLKNEKISKINNKLLSSIRYASIIQSNFFKDKKNIQQLFPNSFIFNQPKDMLSGDFYWFGHKNEHKIIVVADCTGHGVPGALLSILGHSILDELVNGQGIVTPSVLLAELNKSILAAFSNQKHIDFGIDISIVSIKDQSTKILFSGITNGLYYYNNNKLSYFKVTPKSMGTSLTIADLKDQEIQLQKNDSIFLTSDGFADQFGGQSRKKYNLKNLEELFLKLGNQKNYLGNEEILNQELSAWKGALEQTDDVLIVGMRI